MRITTSLLSRPSATLSSIRNGGEGRGEEVSRFMESACASANSLHFGPRSVGNPKSAIANSCGFSLIEIIIVVGLLSVIMLGLMMMFGQTQRVFQTGMTQVDVLEAGRAASGLIAREMEQVSSAGGVTTNFFAGVLGRNPMIQPMPGAGLRTNVLTDVFFLTRENKAWTGIGYFVRQPGSMGELLEPMDDDGSGGSRLTGGRLYRFEKKLTGSEDPMRLWADFYRLTGFGIIAPTNVTQVMDGVVHFKVRGYDTNGFWIKDVSQGNRVFASLVGNKGEVNAYEFSGDALPASVEFELGLMENRTWERYKAQQTASSSAAYRYLTNQVGRLHIFRQLVPVRNVDPSAYQ